MNAEIVREFHFEAAHHLPNHKGKCHRPHGHSYRVEVAYRGEVKELDGSSDEGMVQDFGDIDRRWLLLLAHLDHSDLNEHFKVPTAERLAGYIQAKMDAAWVTVHETDRGRATVWA